MSNISKDSTDNIESAPEVETSEVMPRAVPTDYDVDEIDSYPAQSEGYDNPAFSQKGGFVQGLSEGFKAGMNPALGQRKIGDHSQSLSNDNNNNNNPATQKQSEQNSNKSSGLEKNDNLQKDNDKKAPNNQKDKNGAEIPERKNPLPGGVNPTKKPVDKNNPQKKSVESKENGGKKFNPKRNIHDLAPRNFIRSAASKLGIGKSNNEDGENNSPISNIAKNLNKGGILKFFASTKVKVIAGSIVVILLIIALIFMTEAGTEPAILSTSLCENDNSYNYTGSADTLEFMCKMQSPVGDKSYPVYGYVGEDRGDHTHAGVDLSLGCGTTLYAVQAGKVVNASVEGNYGNSVVIEHDDGKFYTRYGHMQSIDVSVGDMVNKGTKIGEIGNTGYSQGCHVHFELRTKSSYGETVSEINDYFNANSSTIYSNQNVSSEFISSCGSMWGGDNPNATYTGSSASSNDECCVGESQVSNSDVKGLPNSITSEMVAAAVESQAKTGIPVSITFAQMILESGTELSDLATKCYNLFGIKGEGTAGSCNFSTNEVYSGNQVTINANFRKYNNYVESIDDHAKVLLLDRYTKYNAKTGEEWAHAVAEGGYATDPGYEDKLISIMNTYDLKRFDTYKASNKCGLPGGAFDGELYRYYQYDYQNAYSTYGTIATHGCGPTSMAVVVSSLLKEEHDPVELTKFACDNGYCYSSGTSDSFFEKAGEKYNLTVKKYAKSESEEVKIALKQGKLVISIMGAGTFTSGGHFIVLTGIDDNNKVSVHDPASETRSQKTYDFDSVIVAENARLFWVIER